uniref:non-specific serine/threonine protein kinase n=1 Tax=Neospora caninum (strain Liverpool) TaxID=572307 RepID=F0JAV9_NEOCL|nr:unnamed protein product [Neospora caninum Liverpool]CEL71225.1 TPA: hypothetical protein BN1204_068890 [Neospora caninum Liverpool]
MKRISLASICFLVVTCLLLQCLPRDQCLAHYGSDSDGSNARPSGGADWATRTPAPAVGDYGELTGSVSRTQTKRVYGAGLWPRVRSLAVSRFPGAEEEQWEGAYARGDLPPSQAGDILTQRKGRTGRSRVHQRVVVTPEPHSWNHRVTIAKGQAVIPVGFEGSFVESRSLLATRSPPRALVDCQGQEEVQAAVTRCSVEVFASPEQHAAKEVLVSLFDDDRILKVKSAFNGAQYMLAGPAGFLGIGVDGIVLRLNQLEDGAARQRTQVAAKICFVFRRIIARLSWWGKRRLRKKIKRKCLMKESSVRRALPSVTPEEMLEHGLVVPTDVGRLSNLPTWFPADQGYFVLPVVSLYPVFSCDLEQLIHGDLSDSAKLYVTRRLVQSVAWMHEKGVSHNDLKLENVLLSADGQVAIGDFGLSSSLGSVSQVLGTPVYMDPETAESCLRQEEVDVVATRDAWALGILLFTLWCGVLPFGLGQIAHLHPRAVVRFIVTQATGTPPVPEFQLCGQIPAAVRELISGFLQWNHEDRRLPGDVVEAFLEATHNGGGERSRR